MLLNMIDTRIEKALTPEVLTKLALKGITLEQAKNRLRVSALKALANAGREVQ